MSSIATTTAWLARLGPYILPAALGGVFWGLPETGRVTPWFADQVVAVCVLAMVLVATWQGSGRILAFFATSADSIRRWLLVSIVGVCLFAGYVSGSMWHRDPGAADYAVGAANTETTVHAATSKPEELGNRLVQVVRGSFRSGQRTLTVEFGVNRTTMLPGFEVGVTFTGQNYTEGECLFGLPNDDWPWGGGGEPCNSIHKEIGDLDRLHVRPLDTAISPRQSLYLRFRSEKELEITDCFFRSASESQNVSCDSKLIEFSDREY